MVAVAVVAAVNTLIAPDGEPLAARVGVSSGLVVVGDHVEHGAVQEQAVIGETPNLAARLQSIAEPGQVVMLIVACVLIYLAIWKKFEPLLLLPIGFGCLLANLPLSMMMSTDDGGLLNFFYQMKELMKKIPLMTSSMMNWMLKPV